MTIIHAQLFDDGAVLPRSEFERLVELARKSEEVEVQPQEDDAPTRSIMRLAEQGGAFDFCRNERENIYSAEDGEPSWCLLREKNLPEAFMTRCS